MSNEPIQGKVTPFPERMHNLPDPRATTPLWVLVRCQRGSRHDASQTVLRMLRCACGPYGERTLTGGDKDLAWALLFPDHSPVASWGVHAYRGELCLIEGEIYDDVNGLRVVPGNNPDLARWVASHLRQSPSGEPPGLTGVYSGVHVPRDHSSVCIFGDYTGTRPVLWFSDSSMFAATGNLWAFRGCEQVQRSLDPVAFMQMLTLGFPLAGRTWMEGVHHLQRGRRLFAFPDGRIEIRHTTPKLRRESMPFSASLELVRSAIDGAVSTMGIRVGHTVGLALSGGLDSRILLASLHNGDRDFRCFTFCLDPGSVEARIAASAANVAGARHDSTVLEKDLVRGIHRDMRLINEGESPGFGFFGLGAKTVGHADSMLIGYETTRPETLGGVNPFSIRSRGELARRMLRAYMTQFSPDEAARVVAPELRTPWRQVLDEWKESFDSIEQDSNVDVCLDHMTDYSHQRRIRPRIDSVRWFSTPLYPFLDRRVFEAYRRIPVEHLAADRLSLAVLKSYGFGLERLRSAARHFSISISDEYRFRHVIRAGRMVQDRLVGLEGFWRRAAGASRNVLNPKVETELRRLKGSGLFVWPEVERILESARRGRYSNRNCLNRMINAAIVWEFLTDRMTEPLGFLESPREIVVLSNREDSKSAKVHEGNLSSRSSRS